MYKYKTFKVEDGERPGVSIKEPLDAQLFVETLLDGYDAYQEHFGIIATNRRGHVEGFKVLHSGTEGSCTVSMSMVFRAALALDAAMVIVFHNHPTGNPEFSREDVKLTVDLITGGNTVGITVVDHILVHGESSSSMRAEFPAVWER